MKKYPDKLLTAARVTTATDLGHCVRTYRKAKGITLETVAGLSNVSTKFLSEFERGKETAEIGKILNVLNAIGLDLNIEPRGIRKLPSFDKSKKSLQETEK